MTCCNVGCNHIHDPGHAISTAWAAAALDTELTAVFDLHEGFVKGVVDSKSTGHWSFNGWYDPQTQQGEPCTFLRVDLGPFQPWMYSQKGAGNDLTVSLTDGSNTQTVTVLGVDESTSDNQAFHKLVVQGASLPAWVDTGCWYTIDGRRDKLHVAQAGAWAGNASLPGGSFTVFTADPRAALTLNMEGWYLQPDVNQQAYARVIAADPNDSTLTVAGNYSSMSVQGKHWRLFAPPGVQTYTAQAGTLSRWVSALDPRCLFNGYRYESPLAGFYDYPSDTVLYRQIGNNFTGQYYTLHRHYDPYLMRFTSPDPAASPSYNLNAYAGNNPAGAYDPDGLQSVGLSALRRRYIDTRQPLDDDIPESRVWDETAEQTEALVNIAFEEVQAGAARELNFLAQIPWNDLGNPNEVESMPGYRRSAEAEEYGYRAGDSELERFAKRRDMQAAVAADQWSRGGGAPWVADTVAITSAVAGALVVDAVVFYVLGEIPSLFRWGRIRSPNVPGVRPTYDPFMIRIDPITRRGPMAIDTFSFSGKATKYGGVRNQKLFWKAWSSKYPSTLDAGNEALVQRGLAPTVNDHWITHFPEHAGYRGDQLIHHHLGHGPNAIPLPYTVHAKQPGWGIWHPEHAGGN